MRPLLSILIATVPSRQRLLCRLLSHLEPQLIPGIEIITDDRLTDDLSGPSIGAKRQSMLENCNAEYVCYFDDDDLPAPDYVGRICEALEHRPDCIGFDVRRMQRRFPNRPFQCIGIARHTIKNSWQWTEVRMAGPEARQYQTDPEMEMWWFLRTPNHLTPVRRELALKAGFPDRNNGEDRDYASTLMLGGHLKHEIFIGGDPMYEYLLRDHDERAIAGEVVNSARWTR